MSLRNPSMEDLPGQVTVDILSRLPVKTIIHCKCVCKKWLDLVSDSYFANLHFSRTPAGIMVHHISEKEITDNYNIPGILKWVEVEDELDHHHLHHDPVMSLDLNLAPIFQKSKTRMAGSVDGLLCLFQYYPRAESENSYICNPMTREYMVLPNQQYYKDENYLTVNYGFGVGLVTKEYKVIRIIVGDKPSSLLEAEIYTLGTGQWRRLGHVPYWFDGFYGIFLNGHAHWPASSKDSDEKICSFDFDEETFKSFPSPPEDMKESQVPFQTLGVIKGCLCQSNTSNYSKLTLWVMKEYGIKKSWHKELVIKESISADMDLLKMGYVYMIEGLKDGTILMASFPDTLLVYCPWMNTIADTGLFDRHLWGLAYRPSFHRLHDFENERVHVF